MVTEVDAMSYGGEGEVGIDIVAMSQLPGADAVGDRQSSFGSDIDDAAFDDAMSEPWADCGRNMKARIEREEGLAGLCGAEDQRCLLLLVTPLISALPPSWSLRSRAGVSLTCLG